MPLSGTPEYRALEARRLKNDSTLLAAIDGMKQEALERLTTVDPANTIAIMAAQAHWRAADELPTAIERFILAAPPDEEPPE